MRTVVPAAGTRGSTRRDRRGTRSAWVVRAIPRPALGTRTSPSAAGGDREPPSVDEVEVGTAEAAVDGSVESAGSVSSVAPAIVLFGAAVVPVLFAVPGRSVVRSLRSIGGFGAVCGLRSISCHRDDGGSRADACRRRVADRRHRRDVREGRRVVTVVVDGS